MELLIVVHSLIATAVEVLYLIARSWRCPGSRGMSKQRVGFCPSLLSSLWSNTDGNQPHGGKLKQKPWRNTNDLLVSSGFLSCLSQITQDQLPRESTTHSRLNPSASIISQETVPQTCPQASPMEAVLQLWFLLPWCLLFLSSWQKWTSTQVPTMRHYLMIERGWG